MTTPDFAELQRRYADLLVTHGLNVQPGQNVQITTEAVHADFAVQVAEAAYRRGARYVDVDLSDARITRARVLQSTDENLSYVLPYFSTKAATLVREHGAALRILGSPDPDLLSDLDPKKLNDIRLALYEAMKEFYDDGVGKSLLHWSVAAAATPAWGQKVFPDLDGEAACARLWEAIFKMARVDTEDYAERWAEHDKILKARAGRLNGLGIREIHFTGPGTDLVVEISPVAKFLGGSEPGPLGVSYEPNVPTEEVFTTPDCRKTRGHVRATRPFYINGRLIEGLEIEFQDGEVTSFSAAEGEETFGEYISSDPGGKRLGEVALVGIDSPVYQSGLVFQEILFDENAACHIAVGSAYKTCLERGDTLSDEELADIGCNQSSVHTDMMISSAEVDVRAVTRDGDEVDLLRHGEWVL